MTRPTIVGSVTPGDASLPLLVLGTSLGTTSHLWDDALGLLADRFRILRWDLPGHGESPVPAEPFEIAEVAESVLALAEELTDEPFFVAGVSMGGAVSLALALDHPEKVAGLGVICSAARIGTAQGWLDRATAVRAQGTPALVHTSTLRWFAPSFPSREPDTVGRLLNQLLLVDDEGYARCCEALSRFDARDRLADLRPATIVISGEVDVATTPADGRVIAASAPHAVQRTLPAVAHLAPVERPEEVARLLVDVFLTPDVSPSSWATTEKPTTTDAERFEQGMRVRRRVLGAAHVDAANAAITATTADFQNFITRYAWGDVWSRPGLEPRLRSAVTLTALIAGHHHSELAMHVRAAVGNGLSREEIVEIVLQSAIYCSVPSANSAFAVVRTVFAELDDLSSPREH